MTETVLITGCSSGIGRETARAFNAEGWRVYATARDEADVEALAAEGCETTTLDVTEGADVRRVTKRIVNDEGEITCLVNNAGYAQLGPVEDVPIDRVRDQFEVNVFGPHRLTRAVLPHMREQGDGTIVNVSSVIGRLSMPGTGVYAGSKFAMEAMSDALRPEVAEFGVDVVLVEPGPVDTGFTERAEDEADALDGHPEVYGTFYRMFEDSQAIGGGGPGAIHPARVADTILNAASATSPEARYPVGGVAKAGLFARHVPDSWRDGAYHAVNSVIENRLVTKVLGGDDTES